MKRRGVLQPGVCSSISGWLVLYQQVSLFKLGGCSSEREGSAPRVGSRLKNSTLRMEDFFVFSIDDCTQLHIRIDSIMVRKQTLPKVFVCITVATNGGWQSRGSLLRRSLSRALLRASPRGEIMKMHVSQNMYNYTSMYY